MAPTLPNVVAQARGFLTSAINSRSAGADGSLTARTIAADAAAATSSIVSQLGPLAARAVLLGRDDGDENIDGPDYKNDPHKGATNFRNVNNTGVFVLFGLIGCAFVGGGIWFFFWARNGGFYFKDNDWEDYKSTVLRRKGPNGTLLSGATPSTILGGGSVYKDYDANTEYTGGLTQVTGTTGQTDETGSTLTGITGGVSDFVGRAKRKARRERKEREKEKKKDRKNRDRSRGDRGHRRGEDGVLVDEDAEQEAQEHLRAYRGEKAARVGGINKESEGSQWDGSTNPSHSAVSAGDDLLSHREATPTNTPPKSRKKTKRRDRDREKEAAGSSYYRSIHDDATEGEDTETAITGTTTTSAAPPPTSNTRKAGGIRKVYSTAQRNTDREQERMRAEARRLVEKGRSSNSAADEGGPGTGSGIGIGRRFSYQRAESYQRGGASNRQTMASIIDEEGDIGVPSGGGKYLTAGPAQPEASHSKDDGRRARDTAISDVDTGVDEDRGTKSYHCVIPGLSSVGTSSEVGSSVSGATTNYQEEKRKRRAADRASRRRE